jgi:hypothetical protein
VQALGHSNDMCLQGEPGAGGFDAAVRTLCGELEAVGLRVAKHRSGAYSEDASAAASDVESLGIQVLPDGLVVAAAPVGTTTFEEAHATAQSNARTGKLMGTLEDGRCPDQLFLLIAVVHGPADTGLPLG